MGLKDILVLVDQTDESSHRFRLALDLASRHGSRVTAFYAWEWNEEQLSVRRTAEMGLVSAKALGNMISRENAAADRAAERVRSTIDALGRQQSVEIEWRCVKGPASDLLPQHARYADLCIVGRGPVADNGPTDYSLSEKLLFVTGRPVLFIPAAEHFSSLGRHIAVAWNSSRAAARSFNDSMPLLERAERSTVITVNAAESIVRHHALPVEHLIQNLERHGVSAELLHLENVAASSIAEDLQAAATKSGADLMVAGAFGQPRLWERLLGGVTRDILDRMTLPILMSF